MLFPLKESRNCDRSSGSVRFEISSLLNWPIANKCLSAQRWLAYVSQLPLSWSRGLHIWCFSQLQPWKTTVMVFLPWVCCNSAIVSYFVLVCTNFEKKYKQIICSAPILREYRRRHINTSGRLSQRDCA